MDISRPCQPEKLIPLLPWPGFDPSFSGHNDRRAITASGHDYALDHSAIGAGWHLLCGDTSYVGTPPMWGHLLCGDTSYVGTPMWGHLCEDTFVVALRCPLIKGFIVIAKFPDSLGPRFLSFIISGNTNIMDFRQTYDFTGHFQGK